MQLAFKNSLIIAFSTGTEQHKTIENKLNEVMKEEIFSLTDTP